MSIFNGYLTVDEQNEIEDAFINAGVDYDQITRRILTNGINQHFVANFLPKVSDSPIKQLVSDIITLNNTEQLKNASIPFEHWLQNAIRHFRVLPQITTLEKALKRVLASGTPAVVINPEDVPFNDLPELVTDDTDDFQNVSFLETGAKYLSAVIKLSVPHFENDEETKLVDGIPSISSATGWLISNNLILTTYHIVNNRTQYELTISDKDFRKQVTNAKAQFFYNSEEDTGEFIDVKKIIAFGNESPHDYALLRLSKIMKSVPFLKVSNEKIELSEPIQPKEGKVTKAKAVNIIQHPRGGPKQVALRNNLIYSADYPTLYYYTDTLGGSSGAPVCDDNWRVIGMHIAKVAKQTRYNGKVLAYVNQGIQIHSILADLEKQAQTDSEIAQALKEIKIAQGL